MSLSKRHFGALLVLLAIMGSGLRFLHLQERSLWVDELFTLAIAKYHPIFPLAGQSLFRRVQVSQIGDQDSFLTVKAADQSPPLYDLLEKFTVNLLGITELAARLPAALAACALLFFYAGAAWKNPDSHVRRVFAWSTLALVLFPALVLYAKEGRAYSLGTALVGIAGLMWMLRWKEGLKFWRPPSWVEITVFLLACLSHYNAAVLVAVLLAADAVVATKRRDWTTWSRLLVLGLVFTSWLVLHAHTILFTSEGGVAWEVRTPTERVAMTLRDAWAILHPPWLIFTAMVLLAIFVSKKWNDEPTNTPARKLFLRLSVLACIVLAYIAFAGVIAAKAGMAHPRYYIFISPFVAVAMGLVFAELNRHWLKLAVCLALLASAAPSERVRESMSKDDFRSMTRAAVAGADSNTLYLYPLTILRNPYRVYLDQFLGEDPRARMIGLNSKDEAARVCEKLTGRLHVVALGHGAGKSLTDAVYGLCGANWPRRTVEEFHYTYAEHWRVN